MWVYLKKQSLLFNTDNYPMFMSNSRNNITRLMVNDTMIEWPRDIVEMFVSQFTDALKHSEPLFFFDEEKPKFRMRLSGRDDDDEMQSEVGLE